MNERRDIPSERVTFRRIGWISVVAFFSVLIVLASACQPGAPPSTTPAGLSPSATTTSPTTTISPTTPSPTVEGFTLSGTIESIATDTWRIGGETFKIDQSTELDSGLLVGVVARVEYVLLPDGAKLAREIETDNPGSSGTVAPPDSVNLRLVAEGFTSPVGLIPAPDDSGRLFVLDQAGTVWVLTQDGNRLPEPFLDIRAKMVTLSSSFDERGLLGLAFHPSFATNGRFFVYYSAPLQAGGPQGWNHTSHIAEFKVTAGDANKADPASERILLKVDEPQANHNAGAIVFGPDGFLYISLGDGGGANDVGLGHNATIGNGQDTETLLGKILRIDVDTGDPYGIPPDNPFVGKDGRDEIFAFGFRNPFRMSFDSGGQREFFVGDVGQRLREEVDIVTKGGNYGWNIKEGMIWFDPENPRTARPTGPSTGAGSEPLIDPIVEYVNTAGGGEGTAVIGGFVYRGVALPALTGSYVFGDFSASGAAPDGRLFVTTRGASGTWTMKELRVASNASGRLNAFLRAFGRDAAGELYVLAADPRGPEGSTGKIYKIVP